MPEPAVRRRITTYVDPEGRKHHSGTAEITDGKTFSDMIMTTGNNRRKVSKILTEWIKARRKE